MSERVIYKYALGQGRYTTLHMPAGAVIISCKAKEGVVYVWAVVDPEQPRVERKVGVVGTGWMFDDADSVYVGTVHPGAFVFHVFDLGGAISTTEDSKT